MGKYRKKPIIIEAQRWFRNGDHPKDDPEVVLYESKLRYKLQRDCEHCGNKMQDHGWVKTLEGGHIVCPGDYIITGIRGEHYPCKPDIFNETYEHVSGLDKIEKQEDIDNRRKVLNHLDEFEEPKETNVLPPLR